jgi:metallo-beta-lactamase family protein
MFTDEENFMDKAQTKLKLKFIGAAREVTGSKTQISYKNKTYLIDCGLFQGDKQLRQLNWEDIAHAANIDAVILTHAHIDHSGYLPRLASQGFKGPVYCTRATAALLEVLLPDAAYLQEEDAEYANRNDYSSHKPALPLYTVKDAEKVLRQLKPMERDQWVQLTNGLSFQFLRSGHLLGSSFVQVSFNNGQTPKVITFSGDMGSDRSNILKGPVQIKETDYLVMEGTYGDRVHRPDAIENNLIKVIKHIHQRQGVLIIPAFAIGRTQDLLYLINKLEEEKKIPQVPLYIDSPMALKATAVYTKFREDLKLVEDGNRLISSMDESRFKASTTAEQSKNLTRLNGPMIIISAAGMLTGGRVLHHLKARLPFKANAVLFVGFQAHGTKGRLLMNGIDRINIHHEEVMVNAEIRSLEGFSAHADSKEIMDWLKGFSKLPTKVFLNHGERDPLRALKYRLVSELGLTETEIPHAGEEFHLD